MYTPLYVKTNYSILSSLITIDDYINYAKNNNLTSIAITDNNMFATMEFYKKCKANSIKPIIGLEVSIDNKILLLYAKDYVGYQTLIKISNKMYEDSISITDIENYNNNVIGIVFDIKLYNTLKNTLTDLYIGYDNKNREKELLSTTNNIVYVRKNLYINEEEKEYLKYIYMIRDGKNISDDVNYSIDNYNLAIKDIYDYTSNEHLFNTNRIADECNLEFNYNNMYLPDYVDNSSEYLKNLSTLGLTKRLNNSIPDNYVRRLNYELDIIDKMGFSNYFLIVYDYIKYAKKNNILVAPGRGSAVGSLVCYCLGITEIDPIKYDLLFERFLNPERKSMPDIDTDFPDIYRGQVIDYVKEKYGKDKVAGIIAFDTLASKQSLRDVGRVLNIPLYQTDLLTKKIINTKTKLKDIYSTNNEFKELINSDNKLRLLYKIASFIEGYPRNTSVHAAGIVISSINLDEVVPLIGNNDNKVIAYDKDYLEELGLIKMDFLGVTALTTIMNVINDIKNNENIDIDFNKISLEDTATLKIFAEGKTTGIFQFESDGMKNFLRKLKPDRIEDIFAAIALFRPGANKNIDSYINRKHNIENITYLDPSLKDVLKNTYGIITYQEDVIKIAVLFAGYTLGEADILRSAMSKKKKDVLLKEREKFISKSITNNHSEELSSKIYDLILEFAGYGFNKSHAIAYSIVAYKMAYLKYHYPKYFYCNLLSSDSNKTNEYIKEAKSIGLNIVKPDINKSGFKYTIDKEDIYFPLTGIKDIGIKNASDIVNNKDKEYTDIFDFLCKNSSINSKTLEALIKAGVFDSFNISRKTLIASIDELINYKDLVSTLDKEFVLKPELENKEEYSKEELIKMEKEMLGIYLSNHPVTSYKAKYNNIVSLDRVPDWFNKIITCIVLVDKVKVINTKNGDNMMFLSASDEFMTREFTVFPKQYKKNSDIKLNDILKITGRVERRYNLYQIIVENIEKLN